ncbi:MAG: NUDIX domain-containing protein, partial [Candidatus Bathyarchaeia archaeon]
MREITLSSQNIFKGRIFDIKRDLVKLPNGVTVHREFIKHDGAVVVLPLLDSKSIVLIKQFRYSTGRSLFEVPAGNIDKGETPRDCARRELQEETGFSAAKLKKILEFYPAPGYSSEKLHLFLATRLTRSE